MGKTLDTISTINSAVRTILAVAVCGVVGTGSYVAYNTYHEQELIVAKAKKQLDEVNDKLTAAKEEITKQSERILEQETKIAEQIRKIAKLDTSLRLLKVDHRLARIDVLDRSETENGAISKVEFTELSEEGKPIGSPRSFTLRGDQIYVDGRIVKFEDKYVEEAEIDRGTSLFVFNRIFSDTQNPRDGFQIDQVGVRPEAYNRAGDVSDLERKIWGDFWAIANDEAKAKELGIRAAHGEAVSIKPEKGLRYKIMLRASGGLTITPDGRVPSAAFKEGA